MIKNRIISIVKFFFKFLGFDIAIKIKKIAYNRSDYYSLIGKYELLFPHDHKLPEYLKLCPLYSQNLPRIANLVINKYPNSNIIDIGANIGDSVALLNSLNRDIRTINCFEGDSSYLSYLKKNTSNMTNVKIFPNFLGESDTVLKGTTISQNGSLKIQHNEEINSIEFKKLDSIWIENPDLYDVKLMKIDTDGFDLSIIRGSLNLLENAKPVIFFEHDSSFNANNQEDSSVTFKALSEIGYFDVLIYDNYGCFLLSGVINNTQLIKQLELYTLSKSGAFEYYDFCLFHKDDHSLFNEVLASEMLFLEKRNM